MCEHSTTHPCTLAVETMHMHTCTRTQHPCRGARQQSTHSTHVQREPRLQRCCTHGLSTTSKTARSHAGTSQPSFLAYRATAHQNRLVLAPIQLIHGGLPLKRCQISHCTLPLRVCRCCFRWGRRECAAGVVLGFTHQVAVWCWGGQSKTGDAGRRVARSLEDHVWWTYPCAGRHADACISSHAAETHRVVERPPCSSGAQSSVTRQHSRLQHSSARMALQRASEQSITIKPCHDRARLTL